MVNMFFFMRSFLLSSAERCAQFESMNMFSVQELRSVSTNYNLFG